jgi:hypothetical protein
MKEVEFVASAAQVELGHTGPSASNATNRSSTISSRRARPSAVTARKEELEQLHVAQIDRGEKPRHNGRRRERTDARPRRLRASAFDNASMSERNRSEMRNISLISTQTLIYPFS